MQRLRHALTPWRVLGLAVVLLAAQALGLAHGIAHGTGHAHTASDRAGVWGHAHPAVDALANLHLHEHAHTHDHDYGQEAGHDGGVASAECRLYDQLLGHAEVLLPAPEAGVAGATAVPRRTDAATPPGRHAAAAYQARAPPPAA
jgi:hypothetical protein